ncbi:MAG TPA: LPS export ABC transporter periplasmic protein LptC [Rhodocyclaceae bacterium]|nr:LPS export ABC transporter periplasmic protein LptC [Rhodocyclaceae bacterium]
MKFNSSALFPLLMLLLLAGLTFWLERASQQETTVSGKTRHDPDYIVNNFTIKRFDAQGKLYQTLTANEMRHYPDDDSTEAEMPYMTYHRGLKTFINADKAWIDSGGKTIQMERNVRVRHESAKGPETVLTTSTLTVLSDEEIARTKAPVTITQGGTVIHGIGLESNNKTQISVLGGRVQGTIEPQPKQAK